APVPALCPYTTLFRAPPRVRGLRAGASLTRFVGYRAGAACSAYPTIVGGPGVYRAYERGARCACTIGRRGGDRWRHGRADPDQVDSIARAHPFLDRRASRTRRGGL